MNCNRFAGILADFQEGRLSPGEQRAAEAHVHDCEACRGLLAIARGDLSLLPEDGGRELARSIIERTSGPICPRVEFFLCDLVDGELDEENSQLVALHLDHCPACKTIADNLVTLQAVLPGMAGIEPDGSFTPEVVDATSRWRPFRPSLRTRLLAHWSRLVQRPRFSFEAAYVGTLVLVFAFGNPVPLIRNIAFESLGLATIPQAARTTVSRLLPSGWLNAEAPVIRFARGLADGVSRKERTVAGSLNDLAKNCGQTSASAIRWQLENIDVWSRKATGALRAFWSSAVTRISRSKS